MALASFKLYSHREANVDTDVDIQPIRVKIRVFIIMFVWIDPISEFWWLTKPLLSIFLWYFRNLKRNFLRLYRNQSSK